jgi:hypothetical protein
MGSFATVGVMHFAAAEFVAMFGWALAAFGIVSIIAVPKIVVVVDVAIESIGTVEPGTRAEEDTTGKPLRSIVAIRRATVGWYFVIAVRTNRWFSYLNGNLGSCFVAGREEKPQARDS